VCFFVANTNFRSICFQPARVVMTEMSRPPSPYVQMVVSGRFVLFSPWLLVCLAGFFVGLLLVSSVFGASRQDFASHSLILLH
jgi:hypothetical protein